MSSKAEKRRQEFNKREQKRKAERSRKKAISEAIGIEDLAKAMGVPLR